jgi:hypothetical protein
VKFVLKLKLEVICVIETVQRWEETFWLSEYKTEAPSYSSEEYQEIVNSQIASGSGTSEFLCGWIHN